MIPTLLVGDLILVKQIHLWRAFSWLSTPKSHRERPCAWRCDGVLLPPTASLDYIKRVVGVPADEVAYINKLFTINGKAIDTKEMPDFFEEDAMRYFKQFEELNWVGSPTAF